MSETSAYSRTRETRKKRKLALACTRTFRKQCGGARGLALCREIARNHHQRRGWSGGRLRMNFSRPASSHRFSYRYEALSYQCMLCVCWPASNANGQRAQRMSKMLILNLNSSGITPANEKKTNTETILVNWSMSSTLRP